MFSGKVNEPNCRERNHEPEMDVYHFLLAAENEQLHPLKKLLSEQKQ